MVRAPEPGPLALVHWPCARDPGPACVAMRAILGCMYRGILEGRLRKGGLGPYGAPRDPMGVPWGPKGSLWGPGAQEAPCDPKKKALALATKQKRGHRH